MVRSFRLASCARYASAILCVAVGLMVGTGEAQQQKAPSKLPLPKAEPAPKRIVTQGLGKVTIEDLVPCAVNQPGMNIRKNPVGEIVAKDGTRLTVPARNNYQTGPKLPDLYNECNKVTPGSLAEVDLNKLPIVEVDKDGEVVTGFMVADNYFELYINGKLIGVDATPFTPFNSHVVRFRVKRPYTIAVLAQDWEDKLGLGMEVFAGNNWHSGDAGFVARFSDGTATDSSWKAQSFYIAPLAHPDDVVEYGNIHDTSHLGTGASARQVADLPRALLCGALSDPGRLGRAGLRRCELAAGVRISRSGRRHHGDAGLLAVSRSVPRQPLDLDHQSGVRQHGAAAQDGAVVTPSTPAPALPVRHCFAAARR